MLIRTFYYTLIALAYHQIRTIHVKCTREQENQKRILHIWWLEEEQEEVRGILSQLFPCSLCLCQLITSMRFFIDNVSFGQMEFLLNTFYWGVSVKERIRIGKNKRLKCNKLETDYNWSHGELWSGGSSSGVSQIETSSLGPLYPSHEPVIGSGLPLGGGHNIWCGPREFPERMAVWAISN